MIRLGYVPNGIDAIKDYYGDPDKDGDFDLDPEWYRNNTTVIELPFYLRQSWGDNEKVYRLRVHRRVGESLKDAIMVIGAYYGGRFHRDGFDYTGGTYNFRYKRGGQELSTHAFGIAIDLLPEIGCMGCNPRNFPEEIVKAFKRRGWRWGGDFDYPDPMHFQAAEGY